MTIAQQVADDIEIVSPETVVVINEMEIHNPWDLEEVYEALFDFTDLYRFDTENEDYLLHITTGTHVAQICLFLLNDPDTYQERYFSSLRRAAKTKAVRAKFRSLT